MRLEKSALLLCALANIIYAKTEDAPVQFDIDAAGKTLPFQSDAARLLKLFGDHTYTKKETFLRELMSNACDATGKARLENLQSTMTGGSSEPEEYKIVVRADKANGILTVTDNGIGMTGEDLKDLLGTIAKSGTSKFNMESIPKNADLSGFIGQFGVGFYSVFAVADEVTVISKHNKDKQHIWKSHAGASTFIVAEDPRGNTLTRGTQVILKLKPEAKEFLEDAELEKVMKQYNLECDNVGIYLVKHVEKEVPASDSEAAAPKEGEEKPKEEEQKKDVELDETEELKEGEEKKPKMKKVPSEEMVTISQKQKPMMKRDPAELKPEDYKAFYRTLSNDKAEPLDYIHFKAEGDIDFRALLFIPPVPPTNAFAMVSKGVDSLIKVQVRGVFVTAKLDDFLPKYLSFVRGVIDSDDLPLNISRDMIQSTVELRTIQKKVMNKIFEMIENMSKDEDKYKKFFSSYGTHLKLEVIESDRYRNKLAKLLRYQSSTSEGKLTSFAEYIERAKANEKHEKKKTIYFLAGNNVKEIEKSPFLEKLKSANMEVLYLTDTVDEHCIQSLREIDDWKFHSIAKDGLDLDDESDETTKKATEEEFKPLIDYMGKVLKTDVEKVVISSRLTDSPSAVVANQFGWTGNMERVMMSQASSKEDPMLAFFSMQKKIFEINPKNPVIKGMLDRAKVVADEKKPDSALRATIKALYDATLIWSGYTVKDTRGFAKTIDRLARKVLNVAEEPEEPEPVEEDKKDDDDFKLDDMPSLDLDNDEDLKAMADAKTEEPAKEEKKEDAKEKEDL